MGRRACIAEKKIARMIKDWRPLNKPEVAAQVEEWARDLEMRSGRPPRLTWCNENCGVMSLESVVNLVDQNTVMWESVCMNVGTANQITTQLGVPGRMFGAENLNAVVLL
jgi:hypothetical protein